MRKSLPGRRRSWTQKVRIGVPPQVFHVGFGEYDDGRLGEIFIDASKEGSFVRGMCGSLARMTSISLQNGVPIAEVVAVLRHLNFPPNGAVQAEGSEVAVASSLADYLAAEIEAVYGAASPARSSPGRARCRGRPRAALTDRSIE